MEGPNGALALDQLVQLVKAHAHQHYEEDGWDVLVECHSDAEIAEAIGTDTTSFEVALQRVQKKLMLREYDSKRRDIEGEIF